MAKIVATNILSPLGMTSEENFQAILSGRSTLILHEDKWQLSEGFVASMFTDEQWDELLIPDYSKFESLVIRAVERVQRVQGRSGTLFILSTTKGDIGVSPAESAKRIAEYLGIETKPIVVCNACISGLAALMLAERMLESGKYEQAIVCGADVQTDFIVSGFQSLKALAKKTCRPFDIERTGLNLGEASACMVLERVRSVELGVRSEYSEPVSFVNAHGTATMYNDQMESVALERAGLTDVPVNSYKGTFGHTMGAAGILESIISMQAADHRVVLGTRGFEELGVSGKIRVQGVQEVQGVHPSTNSGTDGFLKIISGFGGCNAAMRFRRNEDGTWIVGSGCIRNDAFHLTNPSRNGEGAYLAIRGTSEGKNGIESIELKVVDSVSISNDRNNLSELYRKHVGDYPKFWKMDMLSKLGFIASEMLLQRESERTTRDGSQARSRDEECSDRAIVLFNHGSSICTDRKYLATIEDRQNFFPSPSLFIYTLPNIVTGEIAIRNKYHGETSFYILQEKDEHMMNEILRATFIDKGITSILTGWIDFENENKFEAEFKIVYKTNK